MYSLGSPEITIIHQTQAREDNNAQCCIKNQTLGLCHTNITYIEKYTIKQNKIKLVYSEKPYGAVLLYHQEDIEFVFGRLHNYIKPKNDIDITNIFNVDKSRNMDYSYYDNI